MAVTPLMYAGLGLCFILCAPKHVAIAISVINITTSHHHHCVGLLDTAHDILCAISIALIFVPG